MISYGKQSIDQSDIDAVVKALKSNWLTQGPAIEAFEFDIKNYFGSKYACAVSNGTAALHLTALALGWEKSSSINHICYCLYYLVFAVHRHLFLPQQFVVQHSQTRECYMY